MKSINEIGHVMEMQTVADFVESDAIRQRLKDIGVGTLGPSDGIFDD